MNVAIGLSGGVDSIIAALLLQEAGHHVVGINMRLNHPDFAAAGTKGSCFGPAQEESIARAARMAAQMNIPFHVFDCFEAYHREVLQYFRNTYLSGQTPNPCVQCNALIKFGLLPRLARESGLAFDAFATGHYARIRHLGSRYSLQRAADASKDQSYFLYRLSQEQLAHQLFPLGNLLKSDVRALAEAHHLEAAEARESQDFYGGNSLDLIQEPDRPGDVVDPTGRILGHHNGFWHYTIGQRKGLNLGGGTGEPYYVIGIDAPNNRVLVGTARDSIRTDFPIADLVYQAITPTDIPPEGLECLVKIRSAGHPRGPARLHPTHCSIPSGISGVAPGQSAVFYSLDGLDLLCGGILQ